MLPSVLNINEENKDLPWGRVHVALVQVDKSPRAYGNNGLIAYLTPNGVLGFPFACDDVV